MTGEREQLPPELAELIAAAKEEASVPVAVGFGISTPEQAATVGEVADGVIIGTRLVRAVADAADRDAAVGRGHRLPARDPRRPRRIGFRAVQVVLFTVLGGCVMVIAYALGVPGPVDAVCSSWAGSSPAPCSGTPARSSTGSPGRSAQAQSRRRSST